MGVFLNLYMPPLQTPDEFNHFYRAYQVSEGRFLPQKENHRLGGEMPSELNRFIRPFKFMSRQVDYKLRNEDLATAFDTHIKSGVKEFKDFPNTAYYSPVSYLPQAFAVFVLRQFNASVGVLYYGGRVFIFLTWVVCMFFVIRILPAYRWLITLLILLPTQVYISNSFSADTVTTILSFALLALVLKCALQPEALSKKDLYLIFFVALLLALAKLVYVLLIILVLVIPSSRFKNNKFRLAFLSSLFLASFVLALAWSQVATGFYISYKEYNPGFINEATVNYGSDYQGQKAYILSHAFYFPKVVFNSMFNPEQTYLESYIARFGAFNDFPMPKWAIYLGYFLIFLVIFTEKNKVYLSAKQKLIIALTLICSLALVLLSQHLTWDNVGSGIVELVQGRYLIPLFPLVFILFPFSDTIIKQDFSFVSMGGLLFINALSLQVIFDRYLENPYHEKLDFYCGLEHIDAQGNLITSVDWVRLQGGNSRSTREARAGKYSALVSSRQPYCFTYTFYNLNAGDLLEVEIWKKGDGGQINLSGGEEASGFYFPDNFIEYKESNGWVKMHKLFRMPANVKNGKLGFFISQTSGEVYFDDLHVILRKKKKLER